VARIVQRWRKTKFLSDKDQRRLTCALQNMRMSCNSTYLLDQQTDHGVKADELAALLEQLFVTPEAKAVVFSQWTRTHDIVIRRLEARGIGYVSFHGGVPSDKRPELIHRFCVDPACRVFLSTDAGSTGLNLQHASTLVNMDLPWNPAVLEQRIARVHRLGQARPVQVINFVAKGSIEEGMLSVLAFKRSLSEGILDGGNGEISLGGSRLNRFLKDVESVTGTMGAGEAISPTEEAGRVDDAASEPPAGAVDEDPVVGADLAVAPAGEMEQVLRDAPPDPWQVLLQMGVQFIGALAASSGSGPAAQSWIERDPRTGAENLKLPLPSPEMARQLADVLSAVAKSLRGR
jgi:Helicase conserved C-terminal domain